MPHDFSRAARSLDDIKHWKGIKIMQLFLLILYTSFTCM